MVLALPILLFVMALMINFGTAAAWKVRSLSIARHAVWGDRWPRTGTTNPRPDYWPQSAGVSFGDAGNVPILDDPRVDHLVARGPELPGGTDVDRELLDPSRGLREGTARISREFPLLAKLGEYDLNARTVLLDNKWQYQRTGLWNNRQRRTPVIYMLARAPAYLVSEYLAAVRAILRFPLRVALRVLDRDDEYIYYSRFFGWRSRPPDFHPRLQRFCSLDEDVAIERVEKLVDRIQGKVERDAEGNVVRRIPCLAEVMTGAFIGLYERAIEEGTDGIPPDLSAGQIAQLRNNVSILNLFLPIVQGRHGN